MAKKKRELEAAVDNAVVAEDKHGLAVTSPPTVDESKLFDVIPNSDPVSSVLTSIPQEADDYDPEDDDEYEVEPIPTVSQEISDDASATVAAALMAIGRLYNDAGTISAALTKHLRTTAGQPELQGFLQRMQTAMGEFRHLVDAIETSASEGLHRAIMEGVA